MNSHDDLTQVNITINKRPYKAEADDDWTPIVPAGGDCDSYATAKYVALVLGGWPNDLLRLATCWVEDGSYHCVLLVDFDKKTWVLDNRQTFPTEYKLLNYEWHKVQVAGTQRWEYAQEFMDGLK